MKFEILFALGADYGGSSYCGESSQEDEPLSRSPAGAASASKPGEAGKCHETSLQPTKPGNFASKPR